MSYRTIREFMVGDFVRVPPNTPVRDAHQLMRSANMRDLVVMDGNRLVGMISQLDLYLIETLTGADPASAVVEEAMTASPYVVGPDVSLEEVARTMCRERHGSAVVVDHGEVVGIFTAMDALRALFSVLAGEHAKDSPETIIEVQ